ncbi:MAG: hypothetical protein K0S35_271 [Geminicoccaceae bacterium]|nr:hypothetical protein [Geminicoccaceae bacterium]
MATEVETDLRLKATIAQQMVEMACRSGLPDNWSDAFQAVSLLLFQMVNVRAPGSRPRLASALVILARALCAPDGQAGAVHAAALVSPLSVYQP